MSAANVVVDANPRRRAFAFLASWIEAPAGADVEFRLGVTEFNERAVVIAINGVFSGFTAAEARIVADIAESTMREFPRETASMADLILGLRMCADRAETKPKINYADAKLGKPEARR